MDLGGWLRSLGLEQYEAAFRENAIDDTVLPNLTAEDLKDLGVSLVGHRRKLLDAITSLRTGAGMKMVALDASQRIDRLVRDNAERRHVTVMFSDLVDSTALSGRMDPEDLREIVSAYQKCASDAVRRFGGFVAKFMGDGILVYFGYPEAHEHDTERAVRAGLDLIAAVVGLKTRAPLQARVGIATGLVVIGDLIGSEVQDIVGVTPNLAARLQTIAEPNTVVVADATRKLLGNLFELRDLGARDLKGIAGPTRAWAVLRESSVASRFEALHATGLTALVGREEESELLQRHWARAKAREGQVVLLSGEAGIGKSRLTAALLERLAPEPHTCLRYFCSPQHVDSSLYPIMAQMERAAGLTADDRPQKRLDKLDAWLKKASTSTQHAGLFAEMLSLPNDGRYPTLELTPEERKQSTLEALILQIQSLASQHPVLMIFEDAHWTDPTTLEAFSRTVGRIQGFRVLLVVTFRPEFEPPWTGRPHVTSLTINRLTACEIGAMIDRVVSNKRLPDNIRQGIIERTDGIPLFVEEMTKAVLEAESEGDARNTNAAVPSSAIVVPASLQASLMARLDRLGPAKEVARICAVIGREFDYEMLRAVAGMSETELATALTLLCDAGLTFRLGQPREGRYLFKHALLQDAAYGSLLRADRRDVHRRIAEALEAHSSEIAKTRPELVAHHFTEADMADRAIQYWLKAGQQALRLSGMREAAALLSKGLSLIPAMPDTVHRQEQELDLQIAIGQAIIATQGYAAPAVGQVYTRARVLCEQLKCENKLFPILYGQWAYHSVADLLEAHKLASEIRCFSEAQDNTVMRVMSCRASGLTHLMLGDFAAARYDLEQGLSAYDAAEQGSYASIYATLNPLIFFESYLSLALVCCGDLNSARSRSDSALSHARNLSHAHSLGFALHWTWVARRCAQPDARKLLSDANELVALSDERSFVMWRALGLTFRGWCLTALGQPLEGIPLIASGLAGVRSNGILHVPHVLTLFADAHRMAGQPQIALEHITEAEQFAQKTRAKWLQAETLRLRGDLQQIMGDCDEAEASFREAIDLAHRQNARLFELRASSGLAHLWRNQGRHREADDLLAHVSAAGPILRGDITVVSR
jgi:class 3 adenylate cyclase/tetratricopeptide (TPR) repeat protein